MLERQRKRAALTLMEIMIAIGITVLLVGIVLPVLFRARDRGLHVTEISNLHQLGIAASLYQENEGSYPLRVEPLVRLHYLPIAATQSPLDKTDLGMVNQLITELASSSGNYRGWAIPFRATFIGLGDYKPNRDYFKEYILPNPAGGAFVSLTETESYGRPGSFTDGLKGNYRRLLLDSSVQVRQMSRVYVDSAKTGKGYAQHILFMFVDASDEWKKQLVEE